MLKLNQMRANGRGQEVQVYPCIRFQFDCVRSNSIIVEYCFHLYTLNFEQEFLV